MTLPDVVRAALDLLGLEPLGRLPEPGVFHQLHARFASRVPYQDPGREARSPEAVLEGFIEEGTGAAGLHRTRAFLVLARALGFEVFPVAATLPDGRPHAALVARPGGPSLLAAPGLPLPVPLSLDPPAAGVSSAVGTLTVVQADEGEPGSQALLVEARGETREILRVTPTRIPDEVLEGGGPLDVPEPGLPVLLRHLEDRALLWREGLLEISDAWSRLVLPISSSDHDSLEALFDQPLPPSVASVGADAGAGTLPRLEVFHTVPVDGSELLRRLLDPAGFLELMPAGTRVEERTAFRDGWSWSLRDETGERLRAERAVLLPDGLRVDVTEGSSPFLSRTYRVERDPAGSSPPASRLTLGAVFASPGPPRGPAEAARKTLVFHLVSELLVLGSPPTER